MHCIKKRKPWFTTAVLCLPENSYLVIYRKQYNLYDPEIATLEAQSAADQELYFRAGNLSKVTFENFMKNHKCGVFCRLMELTELA